MFNIANPHQQAIVRLRMIFFRIAQNRFGDFELIEIVRIVRQKTLQPQAAAGKTTGNELT